MRDPRVWVPNELALGTNAAFLPAAVLTVYDCFSVEPEEENFSVAENSPWAANPETDFMRSCIDETASAVAARLAIASPRMSRVDMVLALAGMLDTALSR